MTTRELNRDCRRLINSYKKGDCYTESYLDIEFKEEFLRIYRADMKFEYLTAKNALGLMRINMNLGVVAKHLMGICYEL